MCLFILRQNINKKVTSMSQNTFNIVEGETRLIGALLLDSCKSIGCVRHESPIQRNRDIFEEMRRQAENEYADVFTVSDALPQHKDFLMRAESIGQLCHLKFLAAQCRAETERIKIQKELGKFNGTGIEKLPDLKNVITTIADEVCIEDDDVLSEPTSFQDIAATEFPPPGWVSYPFCLERQFNVIGGPPGCGKSYLAATIGLCAAAGKPVYYGDHTNREPIPVLYVGLEGGVQFARRLQEIGRGYDIPGDIPFHLVQKNPKLWLPESRHTLKVAVMSGKYQLIIIDTWRVCFQLREDQKEGWIEATDFLTDLAQNATVLALHHVVKNRNGYPSVDDLSGAGELGASVDMAVLLRRTKSDVTIHGVKANPLELGALPMPMSFNIHTENGATTLDIKAASKGRKESNQKRREEILEFILSKRTFVSESQIRKAVGGRVESNKKRLDELVEEGEIRTLGNGMFGAP